MYITGLKLQQWRSFVQGACPDGTEFEAQAVRFAYTDTRRMIKYVLDHIAFLDDYEKGVAFAFAVCARSYPAATVSTWIMAAKIKPLPPAKPR